MSEQPDEARWLNEAEQRAWRAYLRGARLLEVALDRDLQVHGLQLSEYEIIAMLSESEGQHLRMSEIADLVVQSRSRLTHTAARLEKRGWVLRKPCPDDRRGVDLVLTEAGQQAIDAMAPLHVNSVREHLIDHMAPAQLMALGEAMAAIRDGIRAAGKHHDERKGLDSAG